ncbi:MAG: DUF1190 domain-containing protein [Beijerinckiaceae bacterium]|nr:DUF1190 domain-containing protein [Beijerinckiaceae bacterium]
MKRSTQIGLGAVGLILVASAWPESRNDNLVYNDAAACRADGKLTPEQCAQRFQEARAAHARDSQKYGSQGACEAEFGPGKCAATPPAASQTSGGHLWAPALVGFMVGRGLMASTSGQPLLPPTRETCPPGNASPECQPARSRSGGGGSWYSTTSGRPVATRGDGTAAATVASRGGFGSLGRGFSSGS